MMVALLLTVTRYESLAYYCYHEFIFYSMMTMSLGSVILAFLRFSLLSVIDDIAALFNFNTGMSSRCFCGLYHVMMLRLICHDDAVGDKSC